MSPIQPEQTSSRASDRSSDAILKHLTARQHVRPHQSILELLDETTELLGCCPAAIRRGIAWLGIDPARLVGRLRRSEIVQLARAVHRFWMQSVPAEAQ